MTLTGFESAHALSEALAQGNTSASDILETMITRVDRFNGGINAVVSRVSDRARIQAGDSDRRHVQNHALGPLDGIPFLVKDSIEVAGLPTTGGSLKLMGYRPESHAPAVANLIGAGAVFMGKTNLPVHAGDYQSDNKVFGSTRNPWNQAHTPGGSSGGAAAAVAAGLTPFDIGSDLAGSIRIPAHFCGVYGHKPSFDIVPQEGQVPPGPASRPKVDMVCLGPIARDARDLDLVLDALGGPLDGSRRERLNALPPPRAGSVHGLRVAFWLEDEALPVDKTILKVLDDAVASVALAGPGALRRAKPDISLARVRDIGRSLIQSVVGANLPNNTYRALRVLASRVGPLAPVDATLRRTAKNLTLSHRDWIAADAERQEIRQECARFFEEFDVLLLPVAPIAAPLRADGLTIDKRTIRINGKRHPAMQMGDWCSLASLAYLPATVAPVGFTDDGLPVGIQIVGPFLGDRTTIAAARMIGEATCGYQRPPGFA